MFRPVTADHVLFNECIYAFRQYDTHGAALIGGKSWSYLLPSFELLEPWQLPYCKIHQSVRVQLPGPFAAFICRVDNPDSAGDFNPNLYGIALASIVSFATGRLCKSTRDPDFCQSQQLTGDELYQLAMLHPVLEAGPGGVDPSLSGSKRNEYKEAISSLISRLHSVPYKTYVTLMQAIRLVHLSLLNKRDDFGLAYLLIVSAIESVAKEAVKRDCVEQAHPSEAAWFLKAELDPDFKKLFAEYRQMRGQSKYLRERYIKFVETFAPVERWEEIVPHPHQDIVDRLKERGVSHDLSHIVNKYWHERYPRDLPIEDIRKILADSYTHRSCFIHEGKQPPHGEPISYNRFFQEFYDDDGEGVTVRLLPNYELLVGIAQHSIRRWADSKSC